MKTYSKLENILLSGQMDDTLLQSYRDISRDDVSLQLAMFRRTHHVKTVSHAVSVLRSVAPEVRQLFSEVEKLIRLLLVCPCASAEAERSFSALRRLKTWLRSTMTQPRLNSVAVSTRTFLTRRMCSKSSTRLPFWSTKSCTDSRRNTLVHSTTSPTYLAADLTGSRSPFTDFYLDWTHTLSLVDLAVVYIT